MNGNGIGSTATGGHNVAGSTAGEDALQHPLMKVRKEYIECGSVVRLGSPFW